ncbi:MAG: MlaC/ttg2D family ABC transporter substrate-binding protein [Alcanivorax sp.]
MRNKALILTLAVGSFLSSPASSSTYLNTPAGVDMAQTGYVLVSTDKDRSESAKQFISNLAETGIGFLEDTTMSDEERKKEFRNVLKTNFDMKTIGRFALGRYWKNSTDKQRTEYLSLFEDMVVNVYSRRFSEYNGEGFEVLSARAQGKKDAVVSSAIVPANGPKISVEWRIREKKDGSMKVIDIMVEGVSMSLTQRSDFASVIQRGGGNIDVLLKHLRKE